MRLVADRSWVVMTILPHDVHILLISVTDNLTTVLPSMFHHNDAYMHALPLPPSRCPFCQRSIGDMSVAWSRLDAEVARTHMPPEYR